MVNPATTPVCPRCGYDQTGAAAAWRESCPVEGQCSECGTGFAWGDLLDPSRADIRWYVEHARHAYAMIRRTPPTFLRMAAPWVFWSQVPVHSATHPGRLVRWLLVFAGVCHLGVWLPVSAFLAAGNRFMSPGWRGIKEVLLSASPAQTFVDLVNGLLWPFYTFTLRGYPMSVDMSIPAMLALPMWVGVAWWLLLTALPTTRGLARLRPAHFVRALILQAGVLVLAGTVLRVVYAAHEHWFLRWLDVMNPAVIMGGLHLWSLVWWACAIRIGWRIESWALFVLGHVAVLISLYGVMVFVMLGFGIRV